MSDALNSDSKVRAIAFYLPQFHPVPENDEWWGEGFTEWRNVTKAKPLFPGHYQPHLPADLGFYDLRLPEVREAQAELARQHGIHGFCYYHYWFNGRRILERPFNEVLQSGKPDFPFCLCWANENWSRAWDGGEKNMLLQQNHSEEDDRAHILDLLPALRDSRYIRINGRPLLIIYRTALLPDPKRTASIWREVARAAGIGEIYLAAVEKGNVNPESIGFDAAIEFSPNSKDVGQPAFAGPVTKKLSSLGVIPKVFSQHSVFRYSAIAEGKKNQKLPAYKYFRCVSPMWDNTPRRKENGRILLGSTPKLYKDWLTTVLKQTCEKYEGDEQIVFINAWNEWAEGCHLEPDLKWGHAYLEATKEALMEQCASTHKLESRVTAESKIGTDKTPVLRKIYWRVRYRLNYLNEIFRLIARLPPKSN